MLAGWLIPAAAGAAHPLVTDDTGTQGAAGGEVEVSATLARLAPAEPSTGLSVHVGVAEAVDLGVGLGLQPPGPADPVLEVKWRFREEARRIPALALRLDYAPPIGGDQATCGHAAGVLLVASETPAERLAVHLNLGGSVRALGTQAPAAAVAASTGAVLHLGAGLQAAADLSLERSPGAAGSSSLLVGLVWMASPRMQLSAGLGPTFAAGEEPRWQATAACTAGFAVRGDR